MNRSLKIGVTSWKSETGLDAQALCRQAEKAESLGFHSFWLPENHFGDKHTMPSPLLLLAAVAARTRKMKLGTVSYLLPIRPPLLAAEDVAVLDQLSGGRVILGIGRGIQVQMFEAFEVPVRDKRKRFAEHLEVMRAAWQGDPILRDKDGESVYLAPLPVQRPHPPIWIAAFGPMALDQVGGLGMPYLASPLETLATLESNYSRYQQAVARAGFDPVTTVPVMRTVFVSENPSDVIRMQSALARYGPRTESGEQAAVNDWAIVGDRHYVRDRLAEYVDCLGVTHIIASGRLPGVSSSEVLASHESLLCC